MMIMKAASLMWVGFAEKTKQPKMVLKDVKCFKTAQSAKNDLKPIKLW